jgi:hypothetical protein
LRSKTSAILAQKTRLRRFAALASSFQVNGSFQ